VSVLVDDSGAKVVVMTTDAVHEFSHDDWNHLGAEAFKIIATDIKAHLKPEEYREFRRLVTVAIDRAQEVPK
jgi:hypothetical protein